MSKTTKTADAEDAAIEVDAYATPESKDAIEALLDGAGLKPKGGTVKPIAGAVRASIVDAAKQAERERRAANATGWRRHVN